MTTPSETPTPAAANGAASSPATPETAQPAVNVDTRQLKSSYCNVCNASSTREEVVLNFGINQNWDMGGNKLDIELHHRVILNPHAARRLHQVLGQLLDEHDKRYGAAG
jgi:hypothetical protein